MFHVKRLYVERPEASPCFRGVSILRKRGSFFEQRPGDLLVLAVVEHRVEIANATTLRPNARPGFLSDLAAERAPEAAAVESVGDQTERVEPFHQQEQRLSSSPPTVTNVHAPLSIPTKPSRCRAARAALAQGAAARHAHEGRARAVEVLAE